MLDARGGSATGLAAEVVGWEEDVSTVATASAVEGGGTVERGVEEFGLGGDGSGHVSTEPTDHASAPGKRSLRTLNGAMVRRDDHPGGRVRFVFATDSKVLRNEETVPHEDWSGLT